MAQHGIIFGHRRTASLSAGLLVLCACGDVEPGAGAAGMSGGAAVPATAAGSVATAGAGMSAGSATTTEAAGSRAPSPAGTAGVRAGSSAPSAGAGPDLPAGPEEMPVPVAGAASPEPGTDAAGEAAPSGETRQRLAVTADFLNKSLSIVDVAKLTEGATREAALVGSVDLSAYSPGPLAFGITPDGKTAIVSISAGWLGAFTTIPAGNDTLVFVDLDKREVSGELYTGAGPMGVAISHDGKYAFVGQFSENYFAMVDIEKRTFERLSTGSSYNEELAIDDTGTVGILTYGPAGNVVTFSVADPMGTLGNTVGLSSDAAGVAFFPGTKQAFLMQAPTTLTGNVGGYNVINAENPTAPVATDDVRIDAAPTWYPVATMSKRQSVAFPMFENGMLSVREMKLEGDKAKEVQTIVVGPTENMAYGVTEDPAGRALLAVQGEHFVGVVDLETQKAFTVPWGFSELGPTEIRMIP